MIRHIVMWKLKEQAEGKPKSENALIIKRKLESLQGEIPGLQSISVFLNSPACSPDTNYDVLLDCLLDDVEALNTYQTHPKHVEAASFVRAVNEGRSCVDYEI